jgi:hypothetical protein
MKTLRKILVPQASLTFHAVKLKIWGEEIFIEQAQ